MKSIHAEIGAKLNWVNSTYQTDAYRKCASWYKERWWIKNRWSSYNGVINWRQRELGRSL